MPTQTVIKSMAWEPPGESCNMGPEYMVRIGKSTAAKLCGMFPMPKMGYETTVAVSDKCAHGFRSFLMVQNISGDYYLSCCNAAVSEWAVRFRVTVLGV